MKATRHAGLIAIVGMILPLVLCGGAGPQSRPAERAAGKPATREATQPGSRGVGKQRAGKAKAALQQEAVDNLSPVQVQTLLDFAKESFPVVYERMSRARDKDPAAFQHMLRRTGPTLMRLQEAKKRNPELGEKLIAEQKVEMQALELKRSYQSATSDAERASIRKAIRDQIEKKFNLRTERLKAEIEDLRRRLDEQNRRLAEQEKNKEQVMDRELEQMLSRRGPM